MRTSSAATATAVATAQDAAIRPLTTQLDEVRRTQYQQQGEKAQVQESRDKGSNVNMWIALVVVVIFGLLSFLTGAIGIGIALYFGTQ
jgi:cobalamin biosynthesis Mg chelatase CobN